MLGRIVVPTMLGKIGRGRYIDPKTVGYVDSVKPHKVGDVYSGYLLLGGEFSFDAEMLQVVGPERGYKVSYVQPYLHISPCDYDNWVTNDCRDLSIRIGQNLQDTIYELANPFVQAFTAVMETGHETAIHKGFWEDSDAIKKIALVHEELGELTSALRKKHPEQDEHCPEFLNMEVEAADAIIRLMDLGRYNNWRIAEAIVAKIRYNSTRGFKHGKKC